MTVYVPTGPAGGGGGGLAFVTTSDTPTVDFAGDGTGGSPLNAIVPLLGITTGELAALAVTTGKIGADQVTYAKMQDVSATDRFLGRDTAGAGDVEEIAPAAGRAILDVPQIAAVLLQSLADAKGDLAVATAADTWGRLAVGADGKQLTASSGAGTGLAWIGDVAYAEIMASDLTTAITVGDAKGFMLVPSNLAGMNLVQVGAAVGAAVSSAGIPTVQLRRVRAGVSADMLSTKLTIDANESTSFTAATPAVIDAANDDVAAGDLIYVDVDVAGTGAKGLLVSLGFQLP